MDLWDKKQFSARMHYFFSQAFIDFIWDFSYFQLFDPVQDSETNFR